MISVHESIRQNTLKLNNITTHSLRLEIITDWCHLLPALCINWQLMSKAHIQTSVQNIYNTVVPDNPHMRVFTPHPQQIPSKN